MPMLKYWVLAETAVSTGMPYRARSGVSHCAFSDRDEALEIATNGLAYVY